jgi:chromosome segregation ATPase
MKKICFLSIYTFLGLLFCVSCTDSQTETIKIENQQLKRKIEEDSTYLSMMQNEMEELYDNLDSITYLADSVRLVAEKLQGKKSKTPIDGQVFIQESLLSIDSIQEYNRERLASLVKQLSTSQNKNAYLTKMVSRLKRTIEEQDKVIVNLQGQLSDAQQEVQTWKGNYAKIEEDFKQNKRKLVQKKQETDSLQNIKDDLIVKIQEKETALSTAFYAVGRKKSLAQKNIIQLKEPLNIAITGLSSQLKESSFKAINREEITEIPIGTASMNTKKVKLIPTRSQASYTFIKRRGKLFLRITNIDAFWKNSKYLAIVVK